MQIYLSRSVTKRIPETLSRQDITGRNAEVSGIANFKVEDFSLERSARVLEWYNAVVCNCGIAFENFILLRHSRLFGVCEGQTECVTGYVNWIGRCCFKSGQCVDLLPHRYTADTYLSLKTAILNFVYFSMQRYAADERTNQQSR